jgi:methionyl-tRNA synthetase
LFKKFWPADVHVVGKEIIRFHCVYWPAFLMAADIAIPARVFAHGWWTVEGEKMSKSVGNVIAPADLITRYGVDGARWGLLRDVPFGNDGNFSHELMTNRINNDLANGLGNLAQRTLTQIYKNCEAKLPEAVDLTAEDTALLQAAQVDLLAKLRAGADDFAPSEMLGSIMDVVNAANLYVDTQAPWSLKKKGETARMGTVLYVLAEVIRCLALAVQPFVPDSSAKLLDQLGVAPDARTFAHLTADSALVSDITLPEPKGVFPRLEMG